MMQKYRSYIFNKKKVAYLPIYKSSSFFPVNRIYCIGRNYEEHALEMGVKEKDKTPFFFFKSSDTIIQNNSILNFPKATKKFHHEIELVVALAKDITQSKIENPLEYVFGYAVGLDMTRRDLQEYAKEKRQPWDFAKNIDCSAPISTICPVNCCGHIFEGYIRLSVNGEVKQNSDIKKMIWKTSQIIQFLSSFYDLKAGDLIFTGTPSGVDSVKPGDVLYGEIKGLESLKISIK